MELKKNNCTNCKYLIKGEAVCGIGDGYSPIRKCVVAINKEIVELISGQKRGKVLDLGCGDWSYVKENLPSGWEWRGVDVVEVGKNGKLTVASDIGSVENIPFKDNYFDAVVCNQSIEHWYEFGVGFYEGISEMSRVLKKGGLLFVNAPIYLHGHKFFLLNKKEKILSLFEGRYWEVLGIEEWGSRRAPMKPYFGWEGKLHPDLMEGRSSCVLNLIFKKRADFRLNFLQRSCYFFRKVLIRIIPLKCRPVFFMITYQNPRFVFYYIRAILKSKSSSNKV